MDMFWRETCARQVRPHRLGGGKFFIVLTNKIVDYIFFKWNFSNKEEDFVNEI